jgi:hypothetical protein
MDSWIHIVVSKGGYIITDSLKAEGMSALELAQRIQDHVSKGGEIVAVTTSAWLSSRQPSSDDLDVMAAEFEFEGE